MDELARPAIEALEARRVRYHPESQHRFAIESLEQRAGLVRLAPALVGPPDPDLDVPRRAPDLARGRRRRRAPSAAPASSCATPTCSTRGSRRRSGRSRRSAGPSETPELAPLLPGRRQRHRPRDHPPLGEPDDLLRPLPARRHPVHRRDHHLDRPRRRRPADVEEPRHRHRPARGGRAARRRRDPLRPAQDLLDAGPALLLGRRSRRGRSSRTSSGTSRG